LNSILAESLYQEDLYEIPGKVIVVLSKNWDDVTEEERTVLSKMLIAVKLNIASVQIITREAFSINDLAALNPSKLLVFGKMVKDVQAFYELTVVNGLPVIVADAIDQLDDAKKKTLWVALKSMFSL